MASLQLRVLTCRGSRAARVPPGGGSTTGRRGAAGARGHATGEADPGDSVMLIPQPYQSQAPLASCSRCLKAARPLLLLPRHPALAAGAAPQWPQGRPAGAGERSPGEGLPAFPQQPLAPLRFSPAGQQRPGRRRAAAQAGHRAPPAGGGACASPGCGGTGGGRDALRCGQVPTAAARMKTVGAQRGAAAPPRPGAPA